MNRKAEADKIINKYRESRDQIRKIIEEYEATERRLYKIMLDELSALEDKDSSPFAIRRELATTLD